CRKAGSRGSAQPGCYDYPILRETDPGPRLAGWFWWWPVAGQLVQPPGVGGRVGLALFLQDPVDVLGNQRGNHVHDVVPVITAPGEPLNRLPGLGRVIGQQLVRHHLVHRHVQPRVDGLAIDDHVVFTLEGISELRVERLKEQRALVRIARVQQLQIEFLVNPVRRGNHPRPPVARLRLIEPAACRLLRVPGSLLRRRHRKQVWSTPARPGPPGLLTAATARRAATASWTHPTIVPALPEQVRRQPTANAGARCSRRSPTVRTCRSANRRSGAPARPIAVPVGAVPRDRSVASPTM